MGEFLDAVPATIQDHLKSIAKDAKAGDGEDAVEKVAEAWLEKKKVFEEKTSEADMEEIDVLGKDDEQGALVLTYSGSLLTIGALVDGKRACSYASIGFRVDTPESAEEPESELAGDVAVDGVVSFVKGPVKSTSNVFKIAAAKAGLSAEEQDAAVTSAATIIEEEFVEVNKTVMM
jgi:hypothetical protein